MPVHAIQETTVITTAIYSSNCNMYQAAFKAKRMWTVSRELPDADAAIPYTGAMNIGKKCAYHSYQW